VVAEITVRVVVVNAIGIIEISVVAGVAAALKFFNFSSFSGSSERTAAVGSGKK
jgi:hypothetical protein